MATLTQVLAYGTSSANDTQFYEAGTTIALEGVLSDNEFISISYVGDNETNGAGEIFLNNRSRTFSISSPVQLLISKPATTNSVGVYKVV